MSDCLQAGLFKGKRALVTGGGGGIGRAIAERFATLGAQVIVTDISVERLRETEALHPSIRGVRCDAASEADINALFKFIAGLPDGLDILVNNVGIAGPIAPISEIAFADWKHTFDVNIHCCFLCCQKALEFFRARGGGAIVNLASIITTRISPQRTPYIATKSAMVGFTAGLAADVGRYGIRANVVSPGLTDTGERFNTIVRLMAELKGISFEEACQAVQRRNAQGKVIAPSSVADAVVFLCSDLSSQINGAEIVVDGLHLDL